MPGRLALWVMRLPLPLYRTGHGWLARARQAAGRSNDVSANGWVTLLSGYFADDQPTSLADH